MDTIPNERKNRLFNAKGQRKRVKRFERINKFLIFLKKRKEISEIKEMIASYSRECLTSYLRWIEYSETIDYFEKRGFRVTRSSTGRYIIDWSEDVNDP